jgi:hypothetical protein
VPPVAVGDGENGEQVSVQRNRELASGLLLQPLWSSVEPLVDAQSSNETGNSNRTLTAHFESDRGHQIARLTDVRFAPPEATEVLHRPE